MIHAKRYLESAYAAYCDNSTTVAKPSQTKWSDYAKRLPFTDYAHRLPFAQRVDDYCIYDADFFVISVEEQNGYFTEQKVPYTLHWHNTIKTINTAFVAY